MSKQVQLKYRGISKVLAMIDPAELVSTGNAHPSGRVLDGSEDHGYAEEWLEPCTYRGMDCMAVYLFDEDEVDHEDAGGYPWDAKHIARVYLDDGEEIKTLTKSQKNAVEIYNRGGAILASEWTTGSGRYVSKRPIPAGCIEVSVSDASALRGAIGKRIRGLLKMHPKAQKLIVVDNVRLVGQWQKEWKKTASPFMLGLVRA